MNATVTKTSALAAMGALLEYPGETFQTRSGEALATVREVNAEAAASLTAFATEVSSLSTEHVRELYTRSFDLSPVCVPYVSVHLFGAESFKRAELMIGLKAAYDRVGFDCGTELPDHIAEILKCAPGFDTEEWSDLVTFALLPATEKMISELEGASSPWRHIVRAVRVLLVLGDETDG